MPKQLVYELFEVTADSPEEAVKKAKEESSRKKSVFVGGSSLRELAHPLHLAEADAAFGMVGIGGKVAPEDREDHSGR